MQWFIIACFSLFPQYVVAVLIHSPVLFLSPSINILLPFTYSQLIVSWTLQQARELLANEPAQDSIFPCFSSDHL